MVKFGGGVDLKEAKTMLFIAERTSIPIPKLLAAYTYGPLPGTKEAPRYRTYIFTEYVPGAIFDNVWDESSDAFKAKVKGELKGYMEELRAIPAPPDYVGPVQNEAIQLYEWRWHSFKHSQYHPLDSQQAVNFTANISSSGIILWNHPLESPSRFSASCHFHS